MAWGNVCSKNRMEKSRLNSQSGAAAAEGALALPVLIGVLFACMSLHYFCYQFLSFQFAVAEVTRQTFSLNLAQRGALTWQTYFQQNLTQQSQAFGINQQQNVQVTFSTAACGNGWGCSAAAQPGDTFSVVATVTQPILFPSIGGVTLPALTFSTQAVAVLQMRETE